MVGVRAGEFRSATRQLAEERVLRPYWKTVAVTLLAIAVSVGLAQAKHMRHLPKHHPKRTEHAQKNAIPLMERWHGYAILSTLGAARLPHPPDTLAARYTLLNSAPDPDHIHPPPSGM
jgi:hypothetical protein